MTSVQGISHIDDDLVRDIVHYMKDMRDVVCLSLTCSGFLNNAAVVDTIKSLISQEAAKMFSHNLRYGDFDFKKTCGPQSSHVFKSFVLPDCRCWSISWTSNINVKGSWTESLSFRCEENSSCLRPIITKILVKDGNSQSSFSVDQEVSMSSIRQFCPWFVATHPVFQFKGNGLLSFKEYEGAMGNSLSNQWWRQIEHFLLLVPVFAGMLTLKGDIVFTENPLLGDINNMNVFTHINWTNMELSV